MIGKAFSVLIALVFTACTTSNQKTAPSAMATAPVSKDSSIKLFLCGDVMTGRGIDQAFATSVDPEIYEPYVKDARQYIQLAEREAGEIDTPLSHSYIWGDAMDVWENEKPALKIINLETSITTNDEPWPDKGINYRMHPENVAALTAAGIDFCSLANNHTLDWERKGLRETLTTLETAGVPTAGAGLSQAEANAPAILKTDKGRVLVFAYGHPSSGIPQTWAATENRSGINFIKNLNSKIARKITERINAAKQPGDVIVF